MCVENTNEVIIIQRYQSQYDKKKQNHAKFHIMAELSTRTNSYWNQRWHPDIILGYCINRACRKLPEVCSLTDVKYMTYK